MSIMCRFSKIFIFKIILLLLSQHVLADSRPIDSQAVTNYLTNIPPDKHGNFFFEFQTSNGITTKTAGNENGHSGVVQYVSPKGLPITFTYVADANGYHPSGDHLPKIPSYITKSIEYIQRHAENANRIQKAN